MISRIPAGVSGIGTPELALRGVPGDRNLLCLHGVGRSGEDFSSFAEALDTAACRVEALDFRGHGESGRMPGRYLVRNYVNDVDAAMMSIGGSPWLFGHSLGGLCALAVAAESPQSVSGIVLEDPPFHGMAEDIFGTRWQAQFTGMREVARTGGSLEIMTAKLAAVRVPGPQGGVTTLGELRSREDLEFSASCLAKIDPEVFTPILEGRWLEGYDYLALLSRVNCPVLLLQGDAAAGGALSDEHARLAAAAARDCRLVRFPGVGHRIRAARPGEVVRLVREFTAGGATRLA
jgi:pimeloyl-ACP methyl ester carboxylesterase